MSSDSKEPVALVSSHSHPSQPSESTSVNQADNERASGTVYDERLERRVWKKLDICVLPVVAMFYLLSFLDRSNIGNARVAGLQSDLRMTNKQYSIALTVTYVPYIAAELPSNLLLKSVGPNLMLPTMLTLWGVITACQGLVRSYHTLLLCRFLLGLFEGGVFPGLVLYCSLFYPRHLLQTRITTFFSSASISGAFSGLLAFGIVNGMEGVGGRPGWAWIFILEGVGTVGFGLVSYWLLPGRPEEVRWLRVEERRYVVERLREDARGVGGGVRGNGDEGFSWREVGMAFKTGHVWIIVITFFLNGTILYALAYFTPSIVQGLGYTSSRAQLMSVPPFAAGFFFSMISAYISDRYHCRGLISLVSSVLCIIGWALFLSTSTSPLLSAATPQSKPHKLQYASLFLTIPGIYTAAPALSTWIANNTSPDTKRATAIAMSFIMTNSGGILATWLMGSLSSPPGYELGARVMLGFSIGMGGGVAVGWWWLWRENRRKKRQRERWEAGERRENDGAGDKSAWYVYSL
ncbi:hypothetical protein AX16_001833 [Volvariella volvacea WC 439]|nr:hypothetical protein AX16_001833 [Volvariella volvacea WC 439]